MSLEGFESLIKKLNRIADPKEALKKGVSLSTKKVQGDAKELAAVNEGQLQNSIYENVEEKPTEIIGSVYTNVPQAVYTEFGTGPKGMAAPKDLPPEIANQLHYRNDMWWIHESQIDSAIAEKYHFIKFETAEGVFYGTYGQEPQPFMYPALKQNQEIIKKHIADEIRLDIKKKG
ncbi:hypothetical protein CIW83_18400 [Tissierella sp. P1]|uniref:HK97-gp10 family putative phage morphogenesis protein n=1 Tax=Tissierella sp. P1 TaxID=1280483 RepID=UPI000B9FBAD6|nr:HK97-gp10 family putative phage morphogenesis protein [Tissierella sp. P1]OZV10789.1 hypothetical protein CIW83_18400 [Tissierella sp. P1]